MLPFTIEWMPRNPNTLVPGRVRMIDQRRLPDELVFLETDDLETLREAILTLQVRGAPAIGIAAAMGAVCAVQWAPADTGARIRAFRSAVERLRSSRPTAVNLFWALERMSRKADSARSLAHDAFALALAQEAVAIWEEDLRTCRDIGAWGAQLLCDGQTVLTHCNAGSLAASQYGTALAPIYHAVEQGMKIQVYADETRPLLQGSRLTAWELGQAGIPVTVICDNMAGWLMRQGKIDAVLVGADRIAANGDTANKIGTYSLAVLARHHQVPFHVLAPVSTMDPACPSGSAIPIEMRDPGEITHGFGRATAPDTANVYAPAFDVTPAELITAIVCERGIIRPPYGPALAKLSR